MVIGDSMIKGQKAIL